MFAKLIHEITGPVIPGPFPGCGRSTRSMRRGPSAASGRRQRALLPYDERRRPMELLTLANALLGHGQLSLAKYLLIVAGEDNPALDVQHVPDFLRHLLERADWRRDLHFQTCTTIDTLDYSGDGLHQGSKVVIAAAGPAAADAPRGHRQPHPDARRVGLPATRGSSCREFWWSRGRRSGSPARTGAAGRDRAIERFCAAYHGQDAINAFPLVVVVDDGEHATRSLANFLWITFTRSNPAADIHGIEPLVVDKHWGCQGSLVIDARIKPHHAPPLVEDPEVTRRVNALAAPGGPLHGVI